MSGLPIKVLHVLGGVRPQGGTPDMVLRFAALELSGFLQEVWVHHAAQVSAPAVRFAEGGVCRLTTHGMLEDMIAGVREAVALWRWVREHGYGILHAHSRPGILAACLVGGCRRDLAVIVHLHALAGRPATYRLLASAARARLVYNSHVTCRHFAGNPDCDTVVPPGYDWPASPARLGSRRVRVVACGSFVPLKHFEVLIEGFSIARQAGLDAELMIFGLQEPAPDPGYRRRLVELARETAGIKLEQWDPRWADELQAEDVFVHLGRPESFGLAILEAFARGCRVVVLPDTFLRDLPGLPNRPGVCVTEGLSGPAVARALQEALGIPPAAEEWWRTRKEVCEVLGPERLRQVLQNLYSSVLPVAVQAERIRP